MAHELALPAATPFARPARVPRRREPTAAFWGLMAFTVVLFVAPQNMVPALQILAPAKTAVAVALVAYLVNRASTGQRLTVMLSPVRWALGLTVLALVSIPTSFWPGGSVTVFLDLFGKSMVIFLLIANIVRTEARMRLLIATMIGAGVLAAAVAVSNFAAGRLETQGVRIAGYESPLALNPNDLALTLNILLALAVGLYGAVRRRRSRFLVLGIALMISGVIVSFSRSGFVTLAALVTVWLARGLRQRGARALLGLIPVALAVVLMLPSGYSERLATITDTQADPTGSAAERLETMREALVLISEYPITGVGLGNNVHVNVARGWIANDAHNAYLKLTAELGVPALIVYVGFIGASLAAARDAQRRLRRRPEGRGGAGRADGGVGGGVAQAVGALFSPVPYHFFFYYPAGLAVAVNVMARRMAGQPAATATGVR
jgi:O-antigen ligase